MCHESFYFCFLSEWVSQWQGHVLSFKQKLHEEALPTVILGNENSIWKCWKAWPKMLLTDGSSVQHDQCSVLLKSRLKAFPNWSAPTPVRLTWQFSCRSAFTMMCQNRPKLSSNITKSICSLRLWLPWCWFSLLQADVDLLGLGLGHCRVLASVLQ